MNRSLSRSSIRYAKAHIPQLVLAVLGIAVGVAVVTSIDLATGSARRAFDLSTETVNGRSTEQIRGGPTGLDEAVYQRLRRDGWKKVAPVVQEYVFLGPDRRRVLTLLGVDPFAEAHFRSFLAPAREESRQWLDLLTQPNTVVASAALAAELGIEVGGTLNIEVLGQPAALELIGLFPIRDGQSALTDLLVTDIATAQELTRNIGRISRIDLQIPDDDERELQLERLRAQLPDGLILEPSSRSSEAARQMTQAFRWNLNALSLLALVCGTFLVYNTMSFSVVQRRHQIGLLRALGVTRREIFEQTLYEAVLLGVAGCAIGLPLGIALARGLVGIVTQTINDLYFVVQVHQLSVDPWTLGKAVALGVGATVIASLQPAREATHAPPRIAMMRSSLESRARRDSRRGIAAGIALIAVGAGLLYLPSRSLPVSLAALSFVLFGCALLTPSCTVAIVRLLMPLVSVLWGWLGRLAAHGIVASMSRTAVAVVALTVAVSVSIGVGIMTASFRTTVDRWLTYSLPADLYVSPARQLTSAGLSLPDDCRQQIETLPGIARVNTVQYQRVSDTDRTFNLVALDIDERSFSAFELASGDRDEAWRAFQAGESVLISEPFAYRHQLAVGDTVGLPTPTGRLEIPISGVFFDYASEQGAVLLSSVVYLREWQRETLSGLSIYLSSGADPTTIKRQIERLLPQDDQPFLVRSNIELRTESLEIFDRTFLITGILRQLATIVAILGILSALMALQLERGRELAVLRATGLTRRQLWQSVTLQNGLLGFIAGTLAIPQGTVLAAILIHVINKRSFGWSLSMEVTWQLLLEAVVVATAAALVAGIYPARRMAATSPAEALRDE